MPKRHQNRRAKEIVGRNNPQKSTVITTGPYKKRETYTKEAAEHKDPAKIVQEEKVPPSFDPTEGRSRKADSQAMMEAGEKRSGSDSNASKHRKGRKLQVEEKEQPVAHAKTVEDYSEDLNPDEFAGEVHGPQGKISAFGLTAADIKELHNTLADLMDDELKNIPIVPLGSRLEQGAKYIDLQHLEQGEFTAAAGMVSDEDHYYVPKKETDYVLWNRLNQVDTPARLDEA